MIIDSNDNLIESDVIMDADDHKNDQDNIDEDGEDDDDDDDDYVLDLSSTIKRSNNSQVSKVFFICNFFILFIN